MNLNSNLVHYQRLHRRIADRTIQSILNEVTQMSIAAEVPIVPVEVAGLLFTVARLASPRRVVEMGTGFGYSTLLLALASVESHIVTIENDADCVRVAQSLFVRAEINDRVSVVHGNAISTLQTISGVFDFAFLDASKEEYLNYLLLLLPRLSEGATIVADDVFFTGDVPGKPLPDPVREKIVNELENFRAFLSEKPYLLTSFLPIGCGMSVTVLTKHPRL